MKEEFFVESYYTAVTRTRVTLPDGRLISDIDQTYVKWNTLHITFRDKTEIEIPLNDFEPELVDQKRPSETHFYLPSPVDDEFPDWESELNI